MTLSRKLVRLNRRVLTPEEFRAYRGRSKQRHLERNDGEGSWGAQNKNPQSVVSQKPREKRLRWRGRLTVLNAAERSQGCHSIGFTISVTVKDSFSGMLKMEVSRLDEWKSKK